MKFSLDIKNNRPDLIKSSQTVLKKDDIVYPGVTEEVCVPELEKTSGMWIFT